jgi:hypothetical protein
MDYLTWLHDALHASQINTNTTDLIIKIWNERDFEQSQGTLSPTEKTVNIILKALANDISYYVTTQPYEISVWSEANDIQETQALLNDFVDKNNFLQQALSEKSSSGVSQLNIYKHSYSSPIMLDPFEEQGTVIRAMFLISANVVEITNVSDVSSSNNVRGSITITTNGTTADYKLLSFSLSWVANPSTRMAGNVELASTINEGAVLSLTSGFPSIADSLNETVLSQMAGDISSDTIYEISFYINKQLFHGNFKLQNSAFSTSPDGVPSIILGWSL